MTYLLVKQCIQYFDVSVLLTLISAGLGEFQDSVMQTATVSSPSMQSQSAWCHDNADSLLEDEGGGFLSGASCEGCLVSDGSDVAVDW